MATIKPIDRGAVHRIQSGQVIVDLCSVVKELVENSLDAHASSIEIRFKGHGLDSIEVQDNGDGIRPEDHHTIAQKHTTSKLHGFDDLASLNTFGFRGEALSSLCAVSGMSIVTKRDEKTSTAQLLIFDNAGNLSSTSVIAASKGTTVMIKNVFQALPVRRKDLEKNIKREYGKAVALLYAYGCIQTNIKFSVTNQLTNGKKSSVFATRANTSVRENIINIFGVKTLAAIIPMSLHLEMGASSRTSILPSAKTYTKPLNPAITIDGYVSKPFSGYGRQAPDRQLFFVNSRPCSLPQVAKAFNEVYKSFNVSQTPFIIANLKMDTDLYDINVSPDKRSILLHQEHELIEELKIALDVLFEGTTHSVPATSNQSQLKNTTRYSSATTQKVNGLEEARDHSTSVGEVPCEYSVSTLCDDGACDLPNESILTYLRPELRVESNEESVYPSTELEKTHPAEITCDEIDLDERLVLNSGIEAPGEALISLDSPIKRQTEVVPASGHVPDLSSDDLPNNQQEPMGGAATVFDFIHEHDGNPTPIPSSQIRMPSIGHMPRPSLDGAHEATPSSNSVATRLEASPGFSASGQSRDKSDQRNQRSRSTINISPTYPSLARGSTMTGTASTLKTENFFDDMWMRNGSHTGSPIHSEVNMSRVAIGVSLSDDFDSESAERRLSLVVNKDDFACMEIIGQFNLGFILALRKISKFADNEDLFIVDQHAADEKWNFERLQRTVLLENQKLVHPKRLDLTVVQQEIITQRNDALAANGFNIKRVEERSIVMDDTNLPHDENTIYQLLSVPISGTKTFDMDDLEELIYLLSELPTGSRDIPRPKKVQRLLAMRACRSSIMVGRSLTKSQMSVVVKHLGEMDKPWNCPHGRPTIRHLASLRSWGTWREDNVTMEMSSSWKRHKISGLEDSKFAYL